MRITDLPFDIINGIASNLSIRDYIGLSNTNRKFYKDLQEEGAARKCVQVVPSTSSLACWKTEPP